MSSSKIRISAVKYANTYPFIYGMTETGFDRKVIIETDHPSQCAEKLISGKVDIGLIPIAALPALGEYYIITDYCLGAYGKVRTVMLLSNCPFSDIKSINLDYHSLSSVNLARILAKSSWKREFIWKNTYKGFITEFNKALSTGVKNIAAVVDKYGRTGTIRGEDLRIYLTENMNFDLNDDKRKAIKLFLEMMDAL